MYNKGKYCCKEQHVKIRCHQQECTIVYIVCIAFTKKEGMKALLLSVPIRC